METVRRKGFAEKRFCKVGKDQIKISMYGYVHGNVGDLYFPNKFICIMQADVLLQCININPYQSKIVGFFSVYSWLIREELMENSFHMLGTVVYG